MPADQELTGTDKRVRGFVLGSQEAGCAHRSLLGIEQPGTGRCRRAVENLEIDHAPGWGHCGLHDFIDHHGCIHQAQQRRLAFCRGRWRLAFLVDR